MSSLLSRRDFIVRSAQAAAVTALVGAIPQPARAGEFTGRIRKAVKYHMVTEDLSVLDKFKLLKDLGFDGT